MCLPFVTNDWITERIARINNRTVHWMNEFKSLMLGDKGGGGGDPLIEYFFFVNLFIDWLERNQSWGF